MKLHILEIPDEHPTRIVWLERQLVDDSFSEFVTQLEACRKSQLDESASSSISLDGIFDGDALSQALQYGLATCSAKQLQQLISNPHALVELQGQVFEKGGSYWMGQIFSSNSEKATLISAEPVGVQQVGVAKRNHGTQPARRSFSKILAIAACVIVFAGVGWQIYQSQSSSVASVKWGWENDGALVATAAAPDYLSKIADGGQEWFAVKPGNANEFKKRLNEMVAGCQKLIDADHENLSRDQKGWLIYNCRQWRKELVKHQAKLEERPELFNEILASTNSTVSSMVDKLRKKAKTLGAA